MNFPLRNLLLPTIIAVATCSVCPAQEPVPITCAEFEKRFPKAIKYQRHGYYTVRVPNSSAVCFFNERNQLSFAIVLNGAKENASKFAEALNMVYDEELTVASARESTVLLVNRRARPYLTSLKSLSLPCNPTFLVAAFAQLGNDKTSRLRFLRWSNRGIIFYYTNDDNDKIHVVFSPANNLITRLHLHPRKDDEYARHKLDLFCKKVLGAHNLSSVNRDLRKDFDLMDVYTGTNEFDPKLFGKIEKGKYVIGQHTNNRLDYLPSPHPPKLPDEESAWPTTPQQASKQQPPPQETERDTQKQEIIDTPPSPIQALKQYLEHINNMFQ